MSLNNVKLFYERLSTDKTFNAQIQSVSSKEECSQIVKAEGYNFTQQEFEDYTAQMLEKSHSEQGFQSLDERELEAVVGGIRGMIRFPGPLPLYGVVPPSEEPPVM
jgi:predicted ribosomally synthesized peptide with nif11-like leader